MPPKITLDTNLFYDKDEGREGAGDLDKIIELAKHGKTLLFFTPTTDFEDKSGGAIRLALHLVRNGILHEAPNAGTSLDFMPGAVGFILVEEEECMEWLRCIWPQETWRSASDNKRNDVYHLIGHKRNGHDIYLTRDREILDKRHVLLQKFGIAIMNPSEFLNRFS